MNPKKNAADKVRGAGIGLPQKLIDALQQEAKSLGITKSQLATRILADHYEAEKPKAQRKNAQEGPIVPTASTFGLHGDCTPSMHASRTPSRSNTRTAKSRIHGRETAPEKARR